MIRTENLYFSYSGSAPYLLDGVNLEFHAGEYVSVMGENGCGKTTLMRLILRFLKPTKGSLECRAERVGYVPQRNDFSNVSFPITVYEMLDSYRRLLRIRDKSVIDAQLERVSMSGYRGELMGTLSGGQTQKVLIARALTGSPDLLILDEPSTGVDIGSQQEIYGFLKHLNRDSGITILSVEHNLEAAVRNSTLIYHLQEGHGHLCSPENYAAEFLKKGN